MQIVNPNTKIDFVGQSRVFASVSAVVFVAMLVLIGVRGFNLGVEFAGGTMLQLQVPESVGEVDEGRLRSSLSRLGHGDAAVVRFGPVSDRSFLVTVQESKEEDKDLEVTIVNGISEDLGADIVRQRTESIGPRVGEELSRAGVGALMLSWALILVYVWFRFDLRYAPGAVAALVHDVVLTAGVFVALGLEFNLQVLAALLVVIGYSLNDTIVIYDRIRENLELRGTTHLEQVVNQSVNQTLSRTLLTSLTTLVVVTALLVLGGPVLRDFALAMLIGVSIGTYSTIYVASALLIFLERRFPVQHSRAT